MPSNINATVPAISGALQSAPVRNNFAIAKAEIEALQTGKVNVEAGKVLSSNDYTTTEKNKLAGIEAGAEVNVNADWNAVSGDAQILNKPTIPTQYTDEQAQDAVGAMVGTSIVYNDAGATLVRAALTGAITATQDSNTTSLGSFTKSQLNTAVSDGDVLYVGDAPTAHTQTLSTISDVTITATNLNLLDDGANTTLHFHNTDRDRANHTGTQASSTISDFNSATRAQVEAELIAGANISITPSGTGASRQLTIASSGGGGGTNATNLTTSLSPTNVIINSDTGTDATIPATDGTNAGVFLPAEKTKLSGIATGATANSTDAQLRDRATHTGTQLSNTISDFNSVIGTATQEALNAKVNFLAVSTLPSTGTAQTIYALPDGTWQFWNGTDYTSIGGGSTPSVTLNALTLATSTFATDVASGSVISAIAGKTAGSTITTSDTRFTVSGSNLLRGLGAVTAGSSTVSLVETLSGATNNPRTSTPAITITSTTSSGFDIILAVGQSNMKGQTAYNASIDTLSANVFQFPSLSSDPDYQTVKATEYPLSHPDNINTGFISPALTFAKRYNELTGRKVIIVPMAVGSTGLVGSNNRWSPTLPGDLYTSSISQANLAITAANAIETGSQYVGAIWIQGEEDASSGITQAAYSSALSALITGFRTNITNATNSFFIIGQMVAEAISTRVNYINIDRAHQEVAWNTDNATFVNTSDLTGFSSDNLHWNSGTASRTVGTRMADAVSTALNKTFPSVPSKVSGLALSNANGTSVQLNFNTAFSGGSAITDYVIQFSTDGNNWTTFADGTSTSTIVSVTGLTPSTNYSYRVAGVNAIGQGTYSDVVTGNSGTASSAQNLRFSTLSTGVTETANGDGWNYAMTGSNRYANNVNSFLASGEAGYFDVTINNKVNSGTIVEFATSNAATSSLATGNIGFTSSTTTNEYLPIQNGAFLTGFGVNLTNGDRVRLERTSGNIIRFHRSTDSGATFSLLYTFSGTVTGAIYPYLFKSGTGSADFILPTLIKV